MTEIQRLRKAMCLKVAEILERRLQLHNNGHWDVDKAAKLLDMAIPIHVNEVLVEDNTPAPVRHGPSLGDRLRQAIDAPTGLDLGQVIELAIARLDDAKATRQ